MKLNKNDAKALGMGALEGGLSTLFSVVVNEELIDPLAKAADLSRLTSSGIFIAFSLLTLHTVQNSIGDMHVEEECANETIAKQRSRQFGRERLISFCAGMILAGSVFMQFSDHNPLIPAYTPDQGNETLAQEVIGAVKTIQNIAAEHSLNLP